MGGQAACSSKSLNHHHHAIVYMSCPAALQMQCWWWLLCFIGYAWQTYLVGTIGGQAAHPKNEHFNSFADIVGNGGCLPYRVLNNRRAVVAKNLPSIRVEGDDGRRWWPEVEIPKMNAGLWGFWMGEAVVAQWSDLSLAFQVIMAARKVSWADKFHPSVSWFKWGLVYIGVASNGPVSRGWWCSALHFSKGGRWWVVVLVIVANQNTKPQKRAWMLVFGVLRVVGGGCLSISHFKAVSIYTKQRKSRHTIFTNFGLIPYIHYFVY